MKVSGVYKIQSKSHPERCYVGSATNIRYRWTQHKYDLLKDKHHSSKLQNHYNKYGKDDLLFSILMKCDPDVVVRKEQCFINIYQPYFNMCPTAGCNRGYKHTEEFKLENSKKWKGVPKTEEHKGKIAEAQMGENNSFAGKHHTIESRLKLREWNLLHPISKETRIKQRETLMNTLREKKQAKLKYQFEIWQQ